VRVGDIVGLGDVVGRVTRIRIRATTILDWDRRELVVPNREFVTGKFVNWTLTDPLIRSSIKVGAAYGTDPQRVLDLLLQAAHDSPFVLPDPAPTAVFSGFGDSALEFQLRVYEQDFDQHPQMLTDVHQRIDRAFRAHGIEMPFPQRDLNLRSSAPLVELLQRAAVPRDGDQLAAQPAAEPRPLR